MVLENREMKELLNERKKNMEKDWGFPGSILILRLHSKYL